MTWVCMATVIHATLLSLCDLTSELIQVGPDHVTCRRAHYAWELRVGGGGEGRLTLLPPRRRHLAG